MNISNRLKTGLKSMIIYTVHNENDGNDITTLCAKISGERGNKERRCNDL